MPASVPYAYCTIITDSHIDYAYALFDSLIAHQAKARLYVLVVDKLRTECSYPPCAGLEVLYLDEIRAEPAIARVIQKYNQAPDNLRWSLKPALMLFLLQQKGCGKVLFTDPDLCFFASADFLYEQLDQWGILLSPHWRSRDPQQNPGSFHLNFLEGMFNGGFVAASNKGIAALKWWLEACLYACERDAERGLYDDQKYLDLLPAQFPEAGVIHHRGCNVASWNRDVNLRSLNENGEVRILEKWEIVFIHFSNSTVRNIIEQRDPLLQPHLEKWKQYLDQAAATLRRPQRNFQDLFKSNAKLHDRILFKLKKSFSG